MSVASAIISADDSLSLSPPSPSSPEDLISTPIVPDIFLAPHPIFSPIDPLKSDNIFSYQLSSKVPVLSKSQSEGLRQ